MFEEVPLSKITIGSHFRQDLGDIAALAASIETVGLLHPIIVNTDYTLVIGRRRLAAYAHLDRATIPAFVIDFDKPLDAEFDENERRKDLTPSEKVAITEELYAHEQAKAKERQREGGKRAHVAGPGRGKKTTSGNVPQVVLEEGAMRPPPPQPRSRDVAAATVGWSGRKYAKAQRVVQAAREDPEFQDLVEEMDRTGNVSRAFSKLPPYLQQDEDNAGEESPPPLVRQVSYSVLMQRVDASFQKTVIPQLRFLSPEEHTKLRDLLAFHVEYLDTYKDRAHAQSA